MRLDPKFTQVLQEIETTRGVPRDRILDALREGVQAAYEKSHGETPNFVVEINLGRGLIEAYLAKAVVENVTDPQVEIDLPGAREIEPEAEIGDEVLVDADISQMGNLAIHTFKQKVKSLIRDAEKDKIVHLYGTRLGEMINCSVLYTERGDLYVETPDKIEGIVPYKEQIPRERAQPGARLKCLLVEVRNTRKAPMLLLSRTHNDLLKELMKNEIPEVREGNIEIVAIARDPGYRAKVAVRSRIPELDPVGSCIGSRGIRITAISQELNDEKIDLVLFKEDPFEFIAEALSPAKVLSVEIFEEDRRGIVVVPDDQISLAIGKGWRNVKLASKLTRYYLDVKSVTEYAAEQERGGPARGTSRRGGPPKDYALTDEELAEATGEGYGDQDSYEYEDEEYAEDYEQEADEQDAEEGEAQDEPGGEDGSEDETGDADDDGDADEDGEAGEDAGDDDGEEQEA
ncbi:transcription termination factor NusA [bacterium]|nr:transcription termination factor NusA [bacterium]